MSVRGNTYDTCVSFLFYTIPLCPSQTFHDFVVWTVDDFVLKFLNRRDFSVVRPGVGEGDDRCRRDPRSCALVKAYKPRQGVSMSSRSSVQSWRSVRPPPPPPTPVISLPSLRSEGVVDRYLCRVFYFSITTLDEIFGEGESTGSRLSNL